MSKNGVEERLIIASGTEDTTSSLTKRIWVESKALWRIAFPSMVFRLTSFGVFLVTQSFIGHIGQVELVACAIVQNILTRFATGVLVGMSSATETLCGQAFGAKQYHMMGIYLQRSWIVNSVTATLMVPFFTLTGPIFRLLGYSEEVASKAGELGLWFIPYVYNMVFTLTIQMYLQAQMKNLIIGVLAASTFVLHILLSWLFVNEFNWGIPGAMGSLVISSWALVVGGMVYIFGGWCPNTWNGFSKVAFNDLLPVAKLSITSGIMLCLELWYDAILVVAAGYMKDADTSLSAFSICLNINLWELTVALGFLGAACVRVSNELGKGDAKAAKFSIKVISGTSMAMGLSFGVLCLGFAHQLGYLFTSNEAVISYVSDLAILLALSILLNGMQTVLTGAAIGGGWQTVVAIVNFCCFYLIGIPIGLLLAFLTNLQAKGLWIGMLTGVAIQTIVLSYITWKIDWGNQVDKASERLNHWLLKTSEEENNDDVEADKDNLQWKV
ncbi:hypothetical protein ACFE04_012788 [Oxalis oulophora]